MGSVFQEAPFYQALYLAYETAMLAAPSAARRLPVRFKGLRSQYFDQSGIAGYASVAESRSEDYYFQGPPPSCPSNEVILDALFHELLELHQSDSTLEVRRAFCDQRLKSFFQKYFPEIDVNGEGFMRLKSICRDLQTEARNLSTGWDCGIGETAVQGGSGLYGRDPAWRDILDTAARVARSNVPMLLTGETGTGKEVLARFIHEHSLRSGGPFIAVDCGALPDNLLESELFGFAKGAFTGAQEPKAGLVTQAHGGTLFLDEIGLMTPQTQGKMLRFLQDHLVRPLGKLNPFKVDVRVLAATNLDLDEARANGDFRPDLYYRLNVFKLNLPPLRERTQDLPALIEHFIKKYNRENQARIPGISPEALEAAAAYHWPGNVRELENAVLHAAILAGAGQIGPRHLPSAITEGRAVITEPPAGRAEPNEEVLARDLASALAGSDLDRGETRRLGRSVPFDLLLRFFRDIGPHPFPPRALADYISPPGLNSRRDKLAGRLLKVLAQADLISHNGRQAQAARYTLDARFFK